MSWSLLIPFCQTWPCRPPKNLEPRLSQGSYGLLGSARRTQKASFSWTLNGRVFLRTFCDACLSMRYLQPLRSGNFWQESMEYGIPQFQVQTCNPWGRIMLYHGVSINGVTPDHPTNGKIDRQPTHFCGGDCVVKCVFERRLIDGGYERIHMQSMQIGELSTCSPCRPQIFNLGTRMNDRL